MSAQQNTYPVEAEVRTLTGKQVKTLRSEGLVPAVLYGHKQESISLTIPGHDFAKTYRDAGSSSLLDLTVKGEKSARKVLVHDIQIDPLTAKIQHVDFYLVNMKEKLQTEIPLEFVGTAPAVDSEGGTLITVRSEVNVECLPQDLVHSIEVDISSLATFDDVIRIKDIKIPAGIEVLDEEDEVVVSVTEPRSEEEMAALDEAVEDNVADVVSETESGTDKAPEDAAEEGEKDKE